MNNQQLFDAAKAVLDNNFTGRYTAPSGHIYPHQWLWDSCFVAIGLRHYDINRAKQEILSLLEAQWHNGMLPNMIFNTTGVGKRHAAVWASNVSPDSPDSHATSGITQPPLLAEAIVKIGEKLPTSERRAWYKQTYPALLRYHEWLYRERDPHGEGLVLLIHPWETGLDNTPPWMQEMHDHQLAFWIRMVKFLHIGSIINVFRSDTKRIPAAQRIHIIDALGLFSAQRRLRRKQYDIHRILKHSLFTIEDVGYNSMLIRANGHLMSIAKDLSTEIPPELLKSIKKTETALGALWDEYSGQYYSRDFVTHDFLKQSSIAALLPLYTGTIPKQHAKTLVGLLENQFSFGTAFPIPSVPVSSPLFDEDGYWQGPSWVNTNWLIIDGLRRMGYADHAEALRQSTIEMVGRSGFYEYFKPNSGEPAGAADFSWTAALIIDLLQQDN